MSIYRALDKCQLTRLGGEGDNFQNDVACMHRKQSGESLLEHQVDEAQAWYELDLC